MKRTKKLFLSSLFIGIMFMMCIADVSAKETNLSQRIRIGVSWAPDIIYFERGIKKSGAVSEVLPLLETEEEAQAVLESIDALVMTGGGDINPACYGEDITATLEEVDDARDLSDMVLLRAALKMDIPILTVCRGMQMLNIVQGGTLYQDIPTEIESDVLHKEDGHYAYHDVFLYEGYKAYNVLGKSENRIYSSHHQAIDTLGEGLIVTGESSDGIIEAVEMPGKTYVIGIQFHPERYAAKNNGEQLEFFSVLKSEGVKYRTKVYQGLKEPGNMNLSLYGYDDIKVEWESVPGANGYAVYYKKGSDPFKLMTRTKKLSVKKENLTDGAEYTFKIVPYIKRGDRFYESPESEQDSVFTLKKVSKPSITKGKDKTVKVSWKDISGEKGYQISRSAKKEGTNIVVSTSQNIKQIKAEKRKTYYYKVRAYQVEDGKKVYGPWSETVSYKMK